MKHYLFPALCTMLLTSPAIAETPMSGIEFENYAQGKTIFYEDGGQNYGAEQYLPNRRVLWSIQDGPCSEGDWYEKGELICFVYDDDPTPKCWAFYQRNGHLVAYFENNLDERPLLESKQSDKPLSCPGPAIGV